MFQKLCTTREIKLHCQNYGGCDGSSVWHIQQLSKYYIKNSEMCHPRCVYKLIGGGIKSITQQVYLIMFIRG